ncbi:MAG TPA: TetR/AcrR family transcriptional regulator [Fimbriimonadaceae bacterium]|nr:TetR/AcrR family transcriptional regulator [Fimbriimonadaceae bacterium]HRJ95233.1 TetR/AcrR family transcriptional regulator [Fimbriimonadaceae bacterium]
MEANTRDRLVVAARDLFLAKGYNATGINEIVRTAGVHPGSLYHYFPTKEDLLVAVLEWYRDHLYDGLLQPVWERIDDPVERVFGLLDGYRQLLEMTNFDLGCPIGNLALELANSHPKARALMQVNFVQWTGAIRECLDAAADRLPEGIDTDSLATHVLTVMEGAVMLARTQRSFEPFDRAILHLRDYFDRLLADGTTWSAPVGCRPLSHLRGDE